MCTYMCVCQTWKLPNNCHQIIQILDWVKILLRGTKNGGKFILPPDIHVRFEISKMVSKKNINIYKEII